MRFTGGWVKVYRQLHDPKYLRKFDGYSRALLIDLVMMANLEDGQEMKRGSKLCKVLRGQVLTSDVELSRVTGFGRAVVRKRLEILEQAETILIKRDMLGTLITICNYEEYQSQKITQQQASDKWQTSDEQVADKSATRIEELKKERKKEEIHPGASHPLLAIWNQNCGELPQATKMTPKRLKAAKARWAEIGSESYWIDTVKILASSEFCKGSNDRGWKADIDFFLRPDTHIKALEGKYDSKKPNVKLVVNAPNDFL